MLKSEHVINMELYSYLEFDASLNSVTEDYSPPSAHAHSQSRQVYCTNYRRKKNVGDAVTYHAVAS